MVVDPEDSCSIDLLESSLKLSFCALLSCLSFSTLGCRSSVKDSSGLERRRLGVGFPLSHGNNDLMNH